MNYRYIIFFLTLVNFFIPLGLVPLFDYDEGAFSEATREMLVTGDYITTYLNGHLRFDKPILIYWLQAFSIKIFGLNEFAVRFPSAVAGSFWVYITYLFTKKFFDDKIALISAIFMLMSLQINIIVKASIADSLLNMTIAYSLFFVWEFISNRKIKYLYLAFAFIAVGTLTKGPIAILIPISVTFIYLSIKREYGLFFRMIFNIKGILIFMIIALPWYILEYLDQGNKFIDGFLLKHNLERFSTTLEYHSGNYFYYFFVILIGLMPFSSYIFSVFKNIKNLIRNDLLLFLFIWFAFVFIFFSISNTKLPHYIIYGYTPVFILMAYYFKKINIMNIVFIISFLLILFFIPDIAFLMKNKIKDLYVLALIDNIKFYFDLKYKIIILLSIVIIVLTYLFNLSQLKKLLIIGSVFSILINYIVIVKLANLTQLPFKEAALISKKNNYNTIMYKINIPGFLFYAQRLNKVRELKIGDVVFTKVSELEKIKKNYKILYNKNGVYLIRIEK